MIEIFCIGTKALLLLESFDSWVPIDPEEK